MKTSYARRKGMNFARNELGMNCFRQLFDKTCPSNREIVEVLKSLGECIDGGLIGWAERRTDLTTKLVPHKLPHKNQRSNNQAKGFLSSWEWRTLRYKTLLKYGRRCMCCGANPDDGETSIHVDHIKPRHKHPELALDESNLQVLCGVCNQGKGAWDETDFRENRTEYEEHMENVYQIELARQAKERQ